MDANCRFPIGDGDVKASAFLPDLTKYISELLQGSGRLCLGRN